MLSIRLAYVGCVLASLACLRPGSARAADVAPSSSDPASAARSAAAQRVAESLAEADRAADPAVRLAVLRRAADAVRVAAPENFLIAEEFQAVERRQEQDPARAAEAWTAALERAREVLLFRPFREAPLPVGFPEPTPLGEIALRRYPVYRAARTDMTFLEGRAFWTLFGHIKEQGIEMTAPVEIEYTDDDAADRKKRSMSFLYRNVDQGTLGRDGRVDVVESAEQTFVSLGLRGEATKARTDDAVRRLQQWLGAHAERYTSDGPPRVLGYNSPFVADSKRYFEVQLPVVVRQ